MSVRSTRGQGVMSENKDALRRFVKMVADGTVLLHDDPQNLVSRNELGQAICSNRPFTETQVDDLIKKKLIVLIDGAPPGTFHPGIALDFLLFHDKLVTLGFPLHARQKIAEMYSSVYWALCSDMDYEMASYRDENGREPSRYELVRLRVINEWAAAETMTRVEERILRFEHEGGPELQKLLAELAETNRKLKKKARFGFEENQIAQVVGEVWSHPHLSTTRDEKSRLSSTLSVSSPHPKRPNSSGGATSISPSATAIPFFNWSSNTMERGITGKTRRRNKKLSPGIAQREESVGKLVSQSSR